MDDEARRASARLPERQRGALSLQGDDGLSYDEIAARMDLGHDAVARLIAHARINLYDELRGTPLASVPSADCERAMGAIAAREDGELEPGSAESVWLGDHLSDCERCALAIEQMREAASAYSRERPVAGDDPQLPGSHRADPLAVPRGTGDPPRPSRISRSRVVLMAMLLALLAAGAAAALAWRGDDPPPAGSAAQVSAGLGAGESVNRKEGDPAGEGGRARGQKAREKTGNREEGETSGESSGNGGAAGTGPSSSGASAPLAAGGGSGDGNAGGKTASNRRSSGEAGVGATRQTSSPRTAKPKSPPTSTQASQPAPSPPTTTTSEAPPPAEEPPDEPGHRGEPPGRPADRPAR